MSSVTYLEEHINQETENNSLRDRGSLRKLNQVQFKVLDGHLHKHVCWAPNKGVLKFYSSHKTKIHS